MRQVQKMTFFFPQRIFKESLLSFGGCPFPFEDSRNRLKTQEKLL